MKSEEHSCIFDVKKSIEEESDNSGLESSFYLFNSGEAIESKKIEPI